MKYTRLWALLCMVLLLTGCFQSDKPETYTVGVLTRDILHDSAELMRTTALQDGLTAAGYTVQLLDAKGDQSIQTGQLQTLLKEGCVGVIVHPVMVSAAPELIEVAQRQDVPMVFTGSTVRENVLQLWDKTAFVGIDPEQPGLQQGNILANTPDKGDINGDGLLSYILIRDTADYADTQLHTAGVFTALTDAEIELVQISLCSAEGDRLKAQENCALLLAEYGKDIEAVICSSDSMALGALEAITEGGRTVGEDIYLVGIGGSEDALRSVAAGNLTGTVREDTETLAKYAIELLQQLSDGTAQQRVYEVECIPVTK